jgi:C4-dicarboxylate-specific signal transduction histidine kinase
MLGVSLLDAMSKCETLIKNHVRISRHWHQAALVLTPSEPFVRIEYSGTQGTGMGLLISRSTVESYGGRLWAADNPPRGASFYIALPTKVEEQA